MAVWEIKDRKGSWKVEAPNWFSAVGEVLDARKMTGLEVGTVFCEVQPAGLVRLRDSAGILDMAVSRVGEAPRVAPPVEDITEDTGPVAPPAPVAAAPRAPTPTPITRPTPPIALAPPAAPKPVSPPIAAPVPVAPPSVIAVAPPVAAAPPAPEALPPTDPANAEEAWSGELSTAELRQANDIAEQLFLDSTEIAQARSPEAAAMAALRILLSVVPAESGAVLHPADTDMSLRFMAVLGPKADAVREMTVPWGKGIAGFCMGTGSVLMVRDAVHDPHHLHEIDEAVGYKTQEMVAAALRDEEGDIYGCIELINPVGGFERWHLDAVRSVATSLAGYMRAHA